MKRYTVRLLEEGRKKYYYILDNDTFQLVLLPTKYLRSCCNCRQRKDKDRDEEIPKLMTVKHTLVSSDMRVFALCSLMELHR